MPEKDADGHVIKGASCFLYTEEMRSFFVDDPQLISTLTDLYDFHAEWDLTLVSGNSKLTNVCMTFLGGTNEEYFKDIYTREAIFGGLLARTCVVAEVKRRKKNSLMFSPPPNTEKHKELAKLMKEITNLKGQFVMTEEAKKSYDTWYNSINEENYSSTGVEARMHTGVLKLAMILSANYNKELKITKDIIEEAIEEVLSLLTNYKRVAASMTTTAEGEAAKIVLQRLLLATNYELTSRELLMDLWGSLSKETLDKVIDTFNAAGIIKSIPVGDGLKFRLSDTVIENYVKKPNG
jgi:hypothetical protein